MTDRTCSIDGCERPHRAHTFCNRHYLRWKRHGDPLAGGSERGHLLPWLIEAIAEPSEDCIEWPFHVDAAGYAELEYLGKGRKGSQVALILSGIPRPEAPRNQALHSCDNPPCVNPRHLRWGTIQENMADRGRRGRTPHGTNQYAAILTDEVVREMRSRRSSGARVKDLAAEFGVTPSTAQAAIVGKTWAHVK